MQYTSVYEDYKRFLTGIFKPIGEKVGWEAKPGEGEKCRMFGFKFMLTVLVSIQIIIFRVYC